MVVDFNFVLSLPRFPLKIQSPSLESCLQLDHFRQFGLEVSDSIWLFWAPYQRHCMAMSGTPHQQSIHAEKNRRFCATVQTIVWAVLNKIHPFRIALVWYVPFDQDHRYVVEFHEGRNKRSPFFSNLKPAFPVVRVISILIDKLTHSNETRGPEWPLYYFLFVEACLHSLLAKVIKQRMGELKKTKLEA